MRFQQNLLKWICCYFIGDISVGHSEKGGGGGGLMGGGDRHWVLSVTFTNGVKLWRYC